MLMQRGASFALKLSQRAEAVAQRTSFADLKESKSRLISELEELMTCSRQSSSKIDQSKTGLKTCKLEEIST